MLPIPGSMSDKPGHILEIPQSLANDLDKAAAGKIPPPPMEAFMSDAALESAERHTAAASAPVHAGDLRPISGAEAARRSTFDGTSLPGHPRQRRVIPAPFRRERAVGAVHHGKAWVTVRAWQLEAGDIVPDIGLVAAVETRNRYKTRAEVMGWAEEDPAPGAAFMGEMLIDLADHPLAPRSDDPVAVGVDIIVRGAGGAETILDSSSEVRAFRPQDPGS